MAAETKRYVLVPPAANDRRMVFDIVKYHGRGKVALRDNHGNRTCDFFVSSSVEYDCFTDYKIEDLKKVWMDMKDAGWIEEKNP